jgi:protocatechuate 3,4-dioxygenase beta subunit
MRTTLDLIGRAGRPRRAVVAGGLLLPLLAVLSAGAQPLAPTPACDDEPTPRQTEGPYYTPSAPERASLIESGIVGEPMVLEGFVVDTACRPVAGAVVDLWQADGAGRYDNDGFRLRGHQRTDATGRWRFATVRPGLYPGRTRHFHVKAAAPGSRVLTTQIYLPGEPWNARDRLFAEALVARVDAAGAVARFDLVLAR